MDDTLHIVYASPWIPDVVRTHWCEKFGMDLGECAECGVISDVEVPQNFTGLAFAAGQYHAIVKGHTVATGRLPGYQSPLFRGMLVYMPTLHENAALYLLGKGQLPSWQFGEFCGTSTVTVWRRIRDTLTQYCDSIVQREQATQEALRCPMPFVWSTERLDRVMGVKGVD